jgi:hypothetical protein
MWVDESDVPAAVPLTDEEIGRLRAPSQPGYPKPSGYVEQVPGDTIRIIDRAGRITQGAITKTGGHRVHAPTEFTVGGRTWSSRWSTIYRIAPGSPETAAPPMSITSEALRDIVADLSGELDGTGRVQCVSIGNIISRALGYDPTIGRSSSQFGGKSDGAWINEHFALGQMKKAAVELCKAGILREVKEGNRSNVTGDKPYVYFGYGSKTGWVLASAYEAAVIAVGGRRADAVDARLLAQARQNIADRHGDEVRAELLVLRAAVGANG